MQEYKQMKTATEVLSMDAFWITIGAMTGTSFEKHWYHITEKQHVFLCLLIPIAAHHYLNNSSSWFIIAKCHTPAFLLIKIISILYPVCLLKKKKKKKADWIDYKINTQAWFNSAWDHLFYELFSFNSVEYQQFLSESEVSVMECYNSLYIHGVPNTTKADF